MSIITTSTAAKGIAQILVNLGYGTIGTDLFVHKEPDGVNVKDDVVTCYDTTPHKPPELNYTYEYPSVQVRVRGKINGGQAANIRAMQLMSALHGYVGSANSIDYRMVRVVNGPIPLGEDERGRPRFTFNLEIHRTV